MPGRRLLAAIVAATALLAACSSPQQQYPPTPRELPVPTGPVAMRILSTRAPYNAYLNDRIYAGTTLASVRSAVPPDPSTNRPGCTISQCWPDVTDRPGVLYVATQLWFMCARPRRISAQLTGRSTLRIEVSVTGQCPPGAGSAAGAPLCLLGVPLKALPHGPLTVVRLWDGSATPSPTASVRLP